MRGLLTYCPTVQYSSHRRVPKPDSSGTVSELDLLKKLIVFFK